MDQDDTFLSFSQDPDESAFRINNETVDSIQVGREGQERQFSPQRSLAGSILGSVEKPRVAMDFGEDELGLQGGIDFGFDGDFLGDGTGFGDDLNPFGGPVDENDVPFGDNLDQIDQNENFGMDAVPDFEQLPNVDLNAEDECIFC
jgi:hypothetical protein